MPRGKYTIVYEKDGARYKLCKIWYGTDGSYYVSSPYHPAQKALLMKFTVNYARSDMQIPFEQAIDLAAAEDDERRLKLAHHPDGLVQFSGEGILSGIDAAGHIRGVGVHSWPLDNPVSGPAFGVVIRGVEEFQRADRIRDELCLFTDAEVFLEPRADVLSLEGHYFPPLWRRFIRPAVDGAPTISVVHPSGAVLRLKVLLPPARCEHQGFIAVELYGYHGDPRRPHPVSACRVQREIFGRMTKGKPSRTASTASTLGDPSALDG